MGGGVASFALMNSEETVYKMRGFAGTLKENSYTSVPFVFSLHEVGREEGGGGEINRLKRQADSYTKMYKDTSKV